MARRPTVAPEPPDPPAAPSVANTDRLVGPNAGDEPVYHKHPKGCRCAKCRLARIKRGDG